MKSSKYFKLILLTILLGAQSGWSNSIKVLQVKGKKAIVEFNPESPLNVGENYQLTTDEGGSLSYDPNQKSNSSRKYALGFDISLSSTQVDTTSTDTTLISGSAYYGWNLESFEFGPAAGMSYTKAGSADASSLYLIGGYGAYNFNKNKSGQNMIFAVEGKGLYGLIQTGSKSYNGFEFYAGPTFKWFFSQSNTAAKIGSYYLYKKYTVGTVDVTTTGFALNAGLVTYF